MFFGGIMISTNLLTPEERRVLQRFCFTFGTRIKIHTMWRKGKLEKLSLPAELKAFRDGISTQFEYPDEDEKKNKNNVNLYPRQT